VKYPVRLIPEPKEGFTAIFPDLEGCVTYGESLSKAIEMNGYLESLDSRSLTVPEPSFSSSPDTYLIPVEMRIAFAIRLKQERKKRGISQQDLAKRMGMDWKQYQRIENPRKTNPTLATIDRIQQALGESVFLNI
jgi:antitoxin HicB